MAREVGGNSLVGRRICLPAGLVGFCTREHQAVTDGSEIAVGYERIASLSGRGSQSTGQLAFSLRCPRKGCLSRTEYNSGLDVRGQKNPHYANSKRWPRRIKLAD